MSETILLVDDDAPIRRLFRRTLEGQGYQLLEACDGHEALGLLANHRGPIDLLLTDVVMPRMDGFTLSDRVGESHPKTRVPFVSGQADQSVAVRGASKRRGERSCSSRSRTQPSCRRFVSSWTAHLTPADQRNRDTPRPDRPLVEEPRHDYAVQPGISHPGVTQRPAQQPTSETGDPAHRQALRVGDGRGRRAVDDPRARRGGRR